MEETEQGYLYDVSYHTALDQDVIEIDEGDDVIMLTKRDLLRMLEILA